VEFYIWKLPEVICRDITLPSDSNKIISIVGPRRIGKTKLLKKHHHSIIKTEFTEKKVYLIDNGFLKSIRVMGREDFGILLENMVFHELSDKYDNIVYFRGGKECDFVLNNNIVLQVCYDLSNPETAKREVKGLKEACKYFGKNKGYIITYDEKYHINENGIDIFVLPAYDLAVTGSLE